MQIFMCVSATNGDSFLTQMRILQTTGRPGTFQNSSRLWNFIWAYIYIPSPARTSTIVQFLHQLVHNQELQPQRKQHCCRPVEGQTIHHHSNLAEKDESAALTGFLPAAPKENLATAHSRFCNVKASEL